MMIWIFRIGVLAAFPLLAYSQIGHDKTAVLMGLGFAVFLVAVEAALESVNLLTLISGVLGASGGIFASKLLDYTLLQMGNETWYAAWDHYSLLRHVALGALGMIVAIRKFPELDTLDKDILALGKRRGTEIKVVDTSAIIDGRIMDICETHFLSGNLVVPRFVLQELQHLADSQDTLKRARGRRGLDILSRLQENQDVPIKIMDRDVPDQAEVDAKIVRLARELGGKVLTTDFNLNKIAALEGVQCLNVNDLANSLKPVVLPGETMSVFVMKEGKEREQGVGYLDDGTMVVVEEGKRHIGRRIEVSVASILQTSAGRMIFSKAKSA
ncbi:MAG: TRAM domain-containing protein [Elusimicrobia bacterium]|nr:TRAM domain-containing protein [Elusimicrobiota bacterium]